MHGSMTEQLLHKSIGKFVHVILRDGKRFTGTLLYSPERPAGKGWSALPERSAFWYVDKQRHVFRETDIAHWEALTDCERWKMLDKKFGTTPDSPLHHDSRCTARKH